MPRTKAPIVPADTAILTRVKKSGAKPLQPLSFYTRIELFDGPYLRGGGRSLWQPRKDQFKNWSYSQLDTLTREQFGNRQLHWKLIGRGAGATSVYTPPLLSIGDRVPNGGIEQQRIEHLENQLKIKDNIINDFETRLADLEREIQDGDNREGESRPDPVPDARPVPEKSVFELWFEAMMNALGPGLMVGGTVKVLNAMGMEIPAEAAQQMVQHISNAGRAQQQAQPQQPINPINMSNNTKHPGASERDLRDDDDSIDDMNDFVDLDLPPEFAEKLATIDFGPGKTPWRKMWNALMLYKDDLEIVFKDPNAVPAGS